MEHLSYSISSLPYSAFGFILPYALVLFFFVIVFQYITSGRIDAGKASGSVFKIAGSTIRLFTRRRR